MENINILRLFWTLLDNSWIEEFCLFKLFLVYVSYDYINMFSTFSHLYYIVKFLLRPSMWPAAANGPGICDKGLVSACKTRSPVSTYWFHLIHFSICMKSWEKYVHASYNYSCRFLFAILETFFFISFRKARLHCGLYLLSI